MRICLQALFLCSLANFNNFIFAAEDTPEKAEKRAIDDSDSLEILKDKIKEEEKNMQRIP